MTNSVPTDELTPKYTATEAPARLGDRLVFDLWLGCFVLIIASTLIQFLLMWLL
jgi:hypothetical protein